MKTKSFYLGIKNETVLVDGVYYLGQLIDGDESECEVEDIFKSGVYYSYEDDVTVYFSPVTYEGTVESLVQVVGME